MFAFCQDATPQIHVSGVGPLYHNQLQDALEDLKPLEVIVLSSLWDELRDSSRSACDVMTRAFLFNGRLL